MDLVIGCTRVMNYSIFVHKLKANCYKRVVEILIHSFVNPKSIAIYRKYNEITFFLTFLFAFWYSNRILRIGNAEKRYL